jgi:hypothetical protein
MKIQKSTQIRKPFQNNVEVGGTKSTGNGIIIRGHQCALREGVVSQNKVGKAVNLPREVFLEE